MVPCGPASLTSLGDRAGQGGDFIDVSGPAVMCKGREMVDANGKWRVVSTIVFRRMDILLSWERRIMPQSADYGEAEILHVSIRPGEYSSLAGKVEFDHVRHRKPMQEF